MDDLDRKIKALQANERAANTRSAYEIDWQHFRRWCQRDERTAMPADAHTLKRYIAAHAEEYTVSTLERRIAGIKHAHVQQGYASPTDDADFRALWKGVRRSKRSESQSQNAKAALTLDDLRAMVRTIYAAEGEGEVQPNRAARDRAILLMGFVGALRRSEIASLRMQDVRPDRRGLLLRIQGSKTDQEGEGQYVALPWGEHTETISTPNGSKDVHLTCPRRAYETWVERAELAEGPVFRGVTRWDTVNDTGCSARTIARTVKKWADAVGLDAEKYAGHSLRSGFVTEAASGGAEDRTIMSQTRHKDSAMVQRYSRPASVWHDNAATELAL